MRPQHNPKGFFQSKDGNFAVISALLTLPLVFAVGMVVDYDLASNRRAKMQNALDAAAFAALALPETATTADRQKVLQANYAANGGPGVALVDGDLVMDAMGAGLKVKSSYDMPTNFMGIIGQKSVPMAAKSSVRKPVKLETARFKILGVTGAWDKVVTLMGRTSETAPYKPLLRMTYVATSVSGYGDTTLSMLDSKGKWKDTYKIS